MQTAYFDSLKLLFVYHWAVRGYFSEAILTQPIPSRMQSRTDIPAALIDLIERMLEKDLTQRIPSVRLVGAELEAIIADRPGTPGIPISATGPPPPSPYRGLFAFREQDASNFFGRARPSPGNWLKLCESEHLSLSSVRRAVENLLWCLPVCSLICA